jgi:hypothetical protein
VAAECHPARRVHAHAAIVVALSLLAILSGCTSRRRCGMGYLSPLRSGGFSQTLAKPSWRPLAARIRAPRELFQTFAGVLLFVTVGVIAVTGVMSFIDAAVVVLTGFGPHYGSSPVSVCLKCPGDVNAGPGHGDDRHILVHAPSHDATVALSRGRAAGGWRTG